MNSRTGRSVAEFRQVLEDNLYYLRGAAMPSASPRDLYYALAHTVRDHLIDRWRKTTRAHYEENPRFVYFLSAEYLPGRQLPQNLMYSETYMLAREAVAQLCADHDLSLSLEDLVELDVEPGLGNGGLGRLAACFLDSLATLDIPAVGYGIRYEFGIFRQTFHDGWQVEKPDEWLYYGNPWEFPQPDNMILVNFGGYTEGFHDAQGNYRVRWISEEHVLGEPYHTLVPGYGTETVNILRLWKARASQEFDFNLFDTGDYTRAVEQKTYSENISKVLYPNDNTPEGRELRLRQQYFFVACSLADIIRRFHIRNDDWQQFPEKVVIQLNDTHPVIAIPELMRILVDEYELDWETAWDITTRTFASTQHTLLPEALEKWPVSILGSLLPRHLEIIYEINHRFLGEVRMRFSNDPDRVTRISIFEEQPHKQVRMANLACVGSFSINGVSELQSQLLKKRVFPDFYEMWPEKFNNKTNGVSPRRFVGMANPHLTRMITGRIGGDWLKDLDQFHRLEEFVDDPAFRAAWQQIKQYNKKELAAYTLAHTGIPIDPESLFDVMVKRLHEYKRQLLKVLHIITLYNRIKENPNLEITPTTFIFGAKAAPGYHMAKLIIKLINAIGEVVNRDPDVRDRLKVVFLENFNVTLAQRIYPAANISEQISMAGKEASGTGNMKFALNGAVTVGTLDGANIEIRERVGAENFFLFGLTATEVQQLKAGEYDPLVHYHANQELRRVIDRIASGYFAHGNTELFRPIVDALLYHDEYLLLADYQSYIEVQDRAAAAYQEQDKWTRMSILNAARCGFFSSDRSIRQYCADIWNTRPVGIS